MAAGFRDILDLTGLWLSVPAAAIVSGLEADVELPLAAACEVALPLALAGDVTLPLAEQADAMLEGVD
jgi:hypothetical protein